MAIGEGIHAPRPELGEPDGTGHVVQFYESDGFLAESVGDFLADGMRLREGVIVVATAHHQVDFRERVRAAGLNVSLAEASGKYVALDAAELLATVMVEGMPDACRFADVFGGLVARVRKQCGKVRIFGEMVALLAMQGNHAAAIRLEHLWNDLRSTQPFSLRCAYPMHRLGGEAFAAAFGQICAEHSEVIPTEDYTTLAKPESRLSAVAALQQKAHWLEVEIAERKRVEEQLRSALEAEQDARRVAEDALRARDEFLADAAHELKTPLTVLIGQAQLTIRRLSEEEHCEPTRTTHALREISRQGNILAHRVDQLLTASQLDDPTYVLEREPTDLVALVRQVIAQLWSDAHPVNFAAPPFLWVASDPRLVKQVLSNLLDNAVRYSPDGGPIEVVLTEDEVGKVILAVRDHGLGIPLDKREHLFDRYSAAHGNEHRSGVGLGLSISRRIVELHGGEIGTQFPGDGGSCFIVRLPTGSDVQNGFDDGDVRHRSLPGPGH